MSLFDTEKDMDKDREKGRDKMPETPDFTKWGAERRTSNPFALDDFRGSNAYKVNQP